MLAPFHHSKRSNSNERFLSLRSCRTPLYALQIISFIIVVDYLTNIFGRNHVAPREFGYSSISETLSANSIAITNTFLTPKNDWKPPSSFDPQLSPFHRDDSFTQQQLQYPWYRPLVYLHSIRPSYRNESERVISLYSQGIRLGGPNGFGRNFTAIGCLVGSNVYPLSGTSGEETLICKVDHEIEDGEFLSVVLESNEYLQKALTLKPVELNHGLKVTLEPGDVNLVPDEYHIASQMRSRTYGKKLYYVRSVTKFEGNKELITVKQRKEKVRYEICGCTQNKLYPHLTEPWVDYHRRIGMDFIIVIDNNATTSLQKTFADRSDVEVYFWPYGKSQVQIWAYILNQALSKCEWLLFFDPDEYMMFGIGKNMEYATRRPLKTYMSNLRQNGTIAMAIYYTLLERSGQKEIPKDPPPKVYVHTGPHQHGEGKMMIRTDYPWTRASVHRHYNMYNGVPSIADGLVEMRKGVVAKPVEISDEPSLIHYRKRSWEEWKIKLSNERATLLRTYYASSVGDTMEHYLKKKKDDTKYTHFKSIWETITEKANMDHQTLVKTRNGKRCTAMINIHDKSVVSESCEEIDEEREDRYNLMKA